MVARASTGFTWGGYHQTPGKCREFTPEDTMEALSATELLLKEKDRTIADLRAEVANLKAVERRLWLANGRLQAACGVATAWRHDEDCPAFGSDEFETHVTRSGELLDEVVGLTPAE